MDAKELLEALVRALVDIPEEAHVTERVGRESSLFEVCAHPDDVGKVIGAQGRTIRSVRIIFAAIAAKNRHRYIIDVISPPHPVTS
ncbi:MAG: hypothetical protein A2722_04135 [Candidatus Doudnabacteria bacterium RIFCSPHIGHO2_01_FULL_50_11]|uniref:RNA-binding protein KhpA n=1 Tax=Candidatus Doudnabacteria bacterium RIFCSPHIGHO2_01_FULL_50_11 TaxID=1817828 RepID=A0A1F5PFF4_9BACT|nr:MAG: hypothetical protein A2722_04135 [Candidatus Doudnabacteria bacterium RIFCSPHIGHO2_01_FULL_50_11]HLC45157.1 KH domain-containing protein [Patescibacteria group bacterium]